MRVPARVVGIADQAASSLGNVAITVVAARALDPKSFGGFAFAFTYYLLTLGMARALASEPLLLRGRDHAGPHGVTTAGAMVALGIPAGLVGVGVGLVVGGPAGQALVALSVVLPLLFLQDGWRYAAFAIEQPIGALFVDGVWLVAQAVAIGAVVLSDTSDSAVFMAAWAGAGALAGIAGAVQFAAVPPLRAGVAWVRENLALGGPFLAEFVTAGGAAYVGLAGLAAVSGLVAVGAVRVAQTVFGPINVLYLGIYLTLVPEGARHLVHATGNLRRSMLRASAALIGLSVAWTALALVVPASIGRAFFGATWDDARPVLLPMGLALCGGGFMAGATAGLRALGAARQSLRTRLLTIPFSLLLPLGGAAVGGEVGFAAGLAASMWIGGVLWWAAFGKAHGAVGVDAEVSPPADETGLRTGAPPDPT
jgi:hypothetical protein